MVTAPREWTYTMNPPAKWLNANDRYKRRPDALIAQWRNLSAALVRYMKVPPIGSCHITATLHWPDRRRRDSANFFPTVKAAVDGIVDAGVLGDDDDTRVLQLTIQRGEQIPRRKTGVQGSLTLTITELIERQGHA